MNLFALDGQFIRYGVESGLIVNQQVDGIGEAQGVRFLCPRCFAQNGGRAGTHSIVCWSAARGVPANAGPSAGRWTLLGTGLSDLTLAGENGGTGLINLGVGCGWHGTINNGEVS